MIDDRLDVAPRVRRQSWLWLLLLCLLCFVAGVAATIWAVGRSRLAHDRLVGPAQVVRVPVRVAVPVPAPPAPTSTPALGALQDRVTALENRIADVDSRASAAVGDAGRAEGLLVTVAARRALDAGMPLGYLEGLLRARFGRSHPAAVATILSAARQPVTLDSLRAGLDATGAALASPGGGRSWWDALRGELGALVIVRRQDRAPTAPADRLDHAKRLLDDGHVDGALAEVARLPGRTVAADWIAGARRYVAARQALETIETAALLEPAAPATPATTSPAPSPADTTDGADRANSPA